MAAVALTAWLLKNKPEYFLLAPIETGTIVAILERLGIFVVLCVGLVALLVTQSRTRQESGSPLFAMATLVGSGLSGTVHFYQHSAGVLIDARSPSHGR